MKVHDSTRRRTSARIRTLVALVAAASVAACADGHARASDSTAHLTNSVRLARTDSADRARRDSVDRARPGYVVDSIFAIEEEIGRFRAEVPDTARALDGGARSRDALVRRLVSALEARDTAALRRLHLTKAEFAWLVFPTSPYARPPLRTKPGLLWMQTVARSDRGITRALQRLGGRPLAVASHRCGASPDVQGTNRIWHGCLVRLVRAPGDTVDTRLFGAIVESGGVFKFTSFANDF